MARIKVDIGGIGGRESHRHSLAAQKATVEAGFNARKKRLRMGDESRPAKRRIVRRRCCCGGREAVGAWAWEGFLRQRETGGRRGAGPALLVWLWALVALFPCLFKDYFQLRHE